MLLFLFVQNTYIRQQTEAGFSKSENERKALWQNIASNNQRLESEKSETLQKFRDVTRNLRSLDQGLKNSLADLRKYVDQIFATRYYPIPVARSGTEISGSGTSIVPSQRSSNPDNDDPVVVD